jgi:serine/threonine protein kinase
MPRRRKTPGVPVRVDEDADAPMVAAPQVQLHKGHRIGRYVVMRQLGRGGMGVVYGAIDPELGRRVAIKIVHDATTQPGKQYSARLRREALALARLDHPNIVSIHDIGVTRHGTFVAMEYVRGQSVRRWLRDSPRDWREILGVFMEAGRGLAAAHAAGLVHRDFKPSNVMVTHDGRTKVLDFGLARGTPSDDPWLCTGEDSLLCKRMTRADTIVGTTGYMPPEQLLGSEVGPLSDQFSFCVALFEALHGERPWDGKDPIDQARAYTQGRRTKVKPRRDVPASVRAAIERGMSLQPSDRFPSMSALLEAIGTRPRRRLRTVLSVLALLGTAWVGASLGAWVDTEPSDQACTRASIATGSTVSEP